MRLPLPPAWPRLEMLFIWTREHWRRQPQHRNRSVVLAFARPSLVIRCLLPIQSSGMQLVPIACLSPVLSPPLPIQSRCETGRILRNVFTDHGSDHFYKQMAFAQDAGLMSHFNAQQPPPPLLVPLSAWSVRTPWYRHRGPSTVLLRWVPWLLILLELGFALMFWLLFPKTGDAYVWANWLHCFLRSRGGFELRRRPVLLCYKYHVSWRK